MARLQAELSQARTELKTLMAKQKQEEQQLREARDACIARLLQQHPPLPPPPPPSPPAPPPASQCACAACTPCSAWEASVGAGGGESSLPEPSTGALVVGGAGLIGALAGLVAFAVRGRDPYGRSYQLKAVATAAEAEDGASARRLLDAPPPPPPLPDDDDADDVALASPP